MNGLRLRWHRRGHAFDPHRDRHRGQWRRGVRRIRREPVVLEDPARRIRPSPSSDGLAMSFQAPKTRVKQCRPPRAATARWARTRRTTSAPSARSPTLPVERPTLGADVRCPRGRAFRFGGPAAKPRRPCWRCAARSTLRGILEQAQRAPAREGRQDLREPGRNAAGRRRAPARFGHRQRSACSFFAYGLAR